MKIYAYQLIGYTSESEQVRIDECEVEEKLKTYVLKGKISNYYNTYIKKSEIGVICNNYFPILFLTERNNQKAKEIYSKHYNDIIAESMRTIDRYKEKLQTIEDSL